MKPRIKPSSRTWGKIPRRSGKSIEWTRREGGGGGGRAALYIFGAGVAISSRFTSRFSPHFSGLSEVTCRTK